MEKAALVVHDLLDGGETPVFVWHVPWFKHVGERRVITTDSLNWSFQVEEATLLNGGGHFGTKSARNRRFVSHDQTSGFGNGLADGVAVPRENRYQVDHFAGNAQLFLGHVGHFSQNVDLSAPT